MNEKTNRKKGIYFFVLEEHKNKIEASNLDAQIAYQLLSLFTSEKIDADDFVRVSGTLMKKYSNQYKSYLNFFIENNMIFVDNDYVVGSKARGYKLREESKSPVIKIEVENTEILKEKIAYFNSDKKKIRTTNETINKMKVGFKDFTKNLNTKRIKEAVQVLDNPNSRIQQFKLIDRIEEERFYFKRNKTNERLDSNLTNLKSEFKFYTLIDNYIQIDITNSQPFFLSNILYNIVFSSSISSNSNSIFYSTYHNDSQNVCNSLNINKLSYTNLVQNDEFKAEVIRFRKAVLDGNFYDELIGLIGVDRNAVKKNIMKIFFSKNESFEGIKESFSTKYPMIEKFIYEYKRINGYNEFAILLQKAESHMVLDVICKEMVENGIIPVTIHDSWIVKKEEKQKALEIIKKHINANLKIEVLSMESSENENKGVISDYKEEMVLEPIKEKECLKTAKIDIKHNYSIELSGKDLEYYDKFSDYIKAKLRDSINPDCFWDVFNKKIENLKIYG